MLALSWKNVARRVRTASCTAVIGILGVCLMGAAQWPSGGPADKKSQPTSPWPKASGDKTAPNPIGIATSGCSLSATAARTFQKQVRILSSSGHTGVDQNFQVSGPWFARLFGVVPALGFFDDSGGPNAFATTERLMGTGQGTILMGVTLISSEIEADPRWYGNGVGIILAHEWAHIRQFSDGVRLSGKFQELHADFLAGWALGVWHVQHMGMDPSVNVTAAGQAIFRKGDYAFNHPAHHGTPIERSGSLSAGYGLAVNERVLDSTKAVRIAVQRLGIK